MPIVTEDGCCCGLRRVDAVLNLDVVPAASGSAYLEFRDTKIICSVYVPSLGRPSANPAPLWGGRSAHHARLHPLTQRPSP